MGRGGGVSAARLAGDEAAQNPNVVQRVQRVRQSFLMPINRSDATSVINDRSFTMQYAQVVAPPTHPHILDLRLDPADLRRLRQMLDQDEDNAARVLHVDRSRSDLWLVTVGCASARVRDLLDSAWG
jgi:hypothetical protein